MSTPSPERLSDAEITGIVDNEAQVKSDISDGLTEYFLEESRLYPGHRLRPVKTVATSSSVGLVEDIVNAAGGVITSVAIEVTGSPITLYNLNEGKS